MQLSKYALQKKVTKGMQFKGLQGLWEGKEDEIVVISGSCPAGSG